MRAEKRRRRVYSLGKEEEEERSGFSEGEKKRRRKKKKKTLHESNQIALIGRYLKTLSCRVMRLRAVRG